MSSKLPAAVRRLIPANLKQVGRQWLAQAAQSRVLHFPADTPPKEGRKAALLSYVTLPFQMPPEDPRSFQFSSVGIARAIVAELKALGYDVDVVEWSNLRFEPRKKYDLFVGHGGINFEKLAKAIPLESPKIYFASGLYWKRHNEYEEQRFQQLEERRGVRLPYDRYIFASEEAANRLADGIICLGNEFARRSFRDFPCVIPIDHASYFDPRPDLAAKNYEAGKSSFLFFASTGNVHKGLDLLLEAFPKTSAHLFVRQDVTPEFRAVYRKELEDTSNIHVYDRVSLRSPEFYHLIDRCNYSIHLSCSEGQPGSVMDTMHQGLIPVLSITDTIDTRDFGITLDNCRIDEIVRTINDLAAKPVEWQREMSRRSRQASLATFCEERFSQQMGAAIQTILDQKVTPKR